MRGAWPGLLACALAVALTAPARAEHVVLPDVASEPDVATEAGAVTLLVRSALGREPGALIAPTGPITMATAAADATKLGADHVVLLQLGRDGTGLRATLVIASRDGAFDVAFVHAGDGDVVALATSIVERVTATTRLQVAAVPPIALGRLRPYADAMRLRSTDVTAAAARLEDAVPATALAVPAIPLALAGLATSQLPPALDVIAARATSADEALAAVGHGSDATALAARVLAQIDARHLDAAQTAFGKKPPRDPLGLLAVAVLAEHRGDDAHLNQALRDVLGGERARSALALASTLVSSRLTPEVHRALLGAATKNARVTAGVASRVGLGAAVAGVDVDKALALVSARELDDVQLAQLAQLVAGGEKTPDRLRLRAELAMRKADGTEAVAIDAYLAVAPTDARAHRYKGWELMAENRAKDAATELAAAGPVGRPETERALLVDGDIAGARAAIVGAPTTADELVIRARTELATPTAGDAVATTLLAEQTSPVDPLVQRLVLDVATTAHDEARAALARKLVDSGAPPQTTGLVPAGSGATAATIHALGTGSAGSAAAAVATTTALGVPTTLSNQLHSLFDRFPELETLQSRHVVLAEIAWHAPLLSLRAPRAEMVRPYLVRTLAEPPLVLRVDQVTAPLDDSALRDSSVLAGMIGAADAMVLFRVEPVSSNRVQVSMFLYLHGAMEVKEISGPLDLDGAVGWEMSRLLPLVFIGMLLVLAGAYWLWRGSAHVKVMIERAPDASDEVFHVEVTKRAARPVVDDLLKLRATTMKAGTKVSGGRGDFVSSGQELRVPPGTYFVHLWGSYVRGEMVRPVPDSATLQVTVKRGQTQRALFDLVPKHADVTIVVEGDDRRRVAVWADNDEHNKVYTDSRGMAALPLAVGSHIVHFEAAGKQFQRTMQIVSPRTQRLPVNVSRELRLGAGDIAVEMSSGGDLQVEVAPEPEPPRTRTRTPTPPAIPPFSLDDPGLLLGRYRITAELGRGAMGVVHRASDEKLERQVAIKEMSEEVRKFPEAMTMFTQEAKALAQLNHTNIVAMYDQVDDGAKVLLIMEFVDGRTLESVLEERGALPWFEAIGITDQVCAGLAYAHARKVIHRDIKPANIFISHDRTVKLGDFGLARVMREVSIRKTEIRGTPLYMAPEQITGENVDHRADLYAVGAMLYQMVCGEPPFHTGEILYHQLHTPPPRARVLKPELPEKLEELILRLMSKSADERCGSAQEIRMAFRELS